MKANQQRSARPHQLHETVLMQGRAVQHGAGQQVHLPPITAQSTTQNVNANPIMMQTTTDDSTNQVFPVRTFKKFGYVQLGFGVILCIINVIGAVLDGVTIHESHTLLTYDITCLILSGWFILTGFIPTCMSKKRRNSWECLKISFMVCSIIGAALFAPGMFSLGVIGSINRSNARDEYSQTIVVSAFSVVFSFVEVVVAIASASYCCCCTAWDTSSPSQQNFIYLGGNNPQIIMIPQTQIQGTGMQPVVLTTTQQQYALRQQQHSQPPTTLNQASGENASMDPPPPYKE